MSWARNERGFALLTSLWLIALAAVIATELLLPARTDRLQVLNIRDGAYSDLAARAGVAHAAARLNAPALSGLEDTWSWNRIAELVVDLDSVPLADGIWYSVRLEDAGARLPLNDVSAEELRRLLLAVGTEFRQADIVAQSVLDWRDEDELHRGNGAEWDDYYRYQEPAVRPRNGPLRSTRELRYVRGMDDELLALMSAYVTIRGDARVNLNTAPEPVLLAVPGMSRELTRYIMNRRRRGEFISNLYELEAALSPPAREVFLAEFAAFASRVSLEPRRLLVHSEGRSRTYIRESRLDAELSRVGGKVIVVRSWQP